MPIYTVYMLPESSITISPPGPGVQPTLDGVTQGDGSHLLGRTITLNSASWLETRILDNDTDFEDNDGSQQTLVDPETINGVTYTGGQRVEAEYRITLRDPDTGEVWTAYAYNVNDSPVAYATVEGLLLRPNANGTFPPIGKALQVTFAGEGPEGVRTNLYDLYDTPPCFTPGTLIDTPDGPRLIETLVPGDLVQTRDHGAQPLRWVGQARLSQAALQASPAHLPVCIAAGALAPGVPQRALVLSPQHRVLVSGWRAEILFGTAEVLVPALAFLGDQAIRMQPGPQGVSYLHLLFDRHEILFAEGAEVESLLPDWLTDATLPPALWAELCALLPHPSHQAGFGGAARVCLTPREGRLVLNA